MTDQRRVMGDVGDARDAENPDKPKPARAEIMGLPEYPERSASQGAVKTAGETLAEELKLSRSQKTAATKGTNK